MPPTVARYEPRGLSKPAIYTFLGLASLPRFRGRSVDGPRAANPLRLLPREMVLHVARFAYRAGYHAHWVQFGSDEEIAVALDVTDTSHVTRLSCMVSSKTYYVEVRFSYAWWGMGLDILALAGLAQQPEGQRKFRFMLEHNDGVGGHDNGHIAVLERNVDDDMLEMPSLGVDSWSYCQDPVTMSVLVDMVRGCVTFGLNGLAGPCVRFPADDTWRSGVQLVARNFPLLAPMDGGRSQGRCIVSCATPPTPPSMLAAASHPRTVAEHLAAGSLRT
ncbi:unnamed protein product, partial [Pelagomonas calceolata]